MHVVGFPMADVGECKEMDGFLCPRVGKILDIVLRSKIRGGEIHKLEKDFTGIFSWETIHPVEFVLRDSPTPRGNSSSFTILLISPGVDFGEFLAMEPAHYRSFFALVFLSMLGGTS